MGYGGGMLELPPVTSSTPRGAEQRSRLRLILPSRCGATGDQRRSKQSHERVLRQRSTARSFLPRQRADASPPRLPLAGLARARNSPRCAANTAWSEPGAAPRGSRALRCAGHRWPLPLPALTTLQTAAHGQKRKGLLGSGSPFTAAFLSPSVHGAKLPRRVLSSHAGC